jgi:hypothetical protein
MTASTEAGPLLLRAATPVTVNATAWMAESELEMREWADQGRRLGTVGRAVGWWIGDWLRYGNQRFGERYARASRITGYDPQTLMNLVYVASSVDPSRRRTDLSFSHHAEVAALEPSEQERWLELAARERFSVRCLREQIRTRGRAEARALEQPKRSAQRAELVCPSCGSSFDQVRALPAAAGAGAATA